MNMNVLLRARGASVRGGFFSASRRQWIAPQNFSSGDQDVVNVYGTSTATSHNVVKEAISAVREELSAFSSAKDYRQTTNTWNARPRPSNPVRYRQKMFAGMRKGGKGDKDVPPAQHPHTIRPKPSNPHSFRSGFDVASHKQHQRDSNYGNIREVIAKPRHGRNVVPESQRQKNPNQKRRPLVWSETPKLGEHLQAANEAVTFSSWIRIDGISPVSTLDAMLMGINAALEVEQAKGMIDLDAPWWKGAPIPFLKPPAVELQDNKYKWVRKAKIILSPFGRPKGW